FLGCALLSALALVPAEVSLAFFSPPLSQSGQENINPKQDGAAVAHTKALLTAIKPFAATSSLDAVLAALSQQGTGVTIDNIQYSVSGQSLTLMGHAKSPDEVNLYRQGLASDLRFTNI